MLLQTLLEQVVIDAINRALCQKGDFPQTLRANIATVVLQDEALSPEIRDERLNKLQKELIAEAAKTVSVSRMPMYQADLTAVQNAFMNVLKKSRKRSFDRDSGTFLPVGAQSEIHGKAGVG